MPGAEWKRRHCRQSAVPSDSPLPSLVRRDAPELFRPFFDRFRTSRSHRLRSPWPKSVQKRRDLGTRRNSGRLLKSGRACEVDGKGGGGGSGGLEGCRGMGPGGRTTGVCSRRQSRSPVLHPSSVPARATRPPIKPGEVSKWTHYGGEVRKDNYFCEQQIGGEVSPRGWSPDPTGVTRIQSQRWPVLSEEARPTQGSCPIFPKTFPRRSERPKHPSLGGDANPLRLPRPTREIYPSPSAKKTVLGSRPPGPMALLPRARVKSGR